ncbi:2-phospho-L-lactate guanylyltransferase [Catellatospora sp. KI3]|uniref:2-phospho-L-lactate guanylyltransferase n=1 Tax=Catellatospora sp. KI3 TaxID=3041620 RepID=UPI0024827C4A|nr:2-phospho-L-lactate guanylyltransferase [Catellatospora sp. KI3]MDI1459523.1 2-phospho-L-lactate guanylyltransferase [Catellatospora sp. KI3]
MPALPVTVLVPLKPLAEAKTRLRGAEADHEGLVLDLARRTVRAARAAAGVARVYVVTRDRTAARELRGCGAEIVGDTGRDLNQALSRAAALLAGAGRLAALPADLPALRPDELAQALAQAGPDRAFVPDAAGVGTVLLVSAVGGRLDPRFGLGSAAAHELSGARRLTGAWPTLRRDVDTAEDLAAVRAWGLPYARPAA